MATKKAAKKANTSTNDRASPRKPRHAGKTFPENTIVPGSDPVPNEDAEVASPKKVKKRSVEDRLAELERNANLHGWHLDYGDDAPDAQ